ncbi:hypothetical protein Sste5346_006030 [Sporothrix stenoceras]|uniref:Uncharacterized protein n=1 Tax=Sporothrix stenoceras TaxID=5173 RepID=A0ABR3Z406_9PEZI
MDSPTYQEPDQELDQQLEQELFGSDTEEATPAKSKANNTHTPFLPLPTPMPMFMPMPAMPALPATPAKVVSARASQKAYPTRSCSAASIPDFDGDQKRQLWKMVKATQRRGSKTTDPKQLLQRFLDRQHAAPVPQPPYTAPVPVAPVTHLQHNIPISTQQQPKANPPPPGAKISHARDKNSENRIGQYDWYDEFPTRSNWTARVGDCQVQVKYSKQGELKPIVKFDRKILEAYVRGCEQHGIPLRLWIQNSATMHTDRFPSRASSMCRATNCPVRNNTIARGMYQVCFDEHPTETSNGRFDPFYVAGYMHLFCLEEMIPMAELMTCADVQPDTRDFPLEQRNPMSLNRDGAGRTLLGAYNEWKSAHYDRYVYNDISIPKATRRSSDCLYKFLTVKKMEAQPSTRQKMRDQRNGFDISKHCGNLRKLVTHKADAKKKRKQARSDSSEDGDADSDLEVVLPPRASAPKRVRTEAANVAAASAYPPLQSPLRRSRRLSGAYAAQHINMPAQTMAAAPVPTSQIPYMPYDMRYDLGTMAVPSMSGSPPRSVRAASIGLNVRTDLTLPTAPTNILDFNTANLDVDSDSFWNVYNDIYSKDQQVLPLTGLPPLASYGASPSSPYKLRDTQARRQSAVRLVSARASQVTHSLSSAGLINPLTAGLIDPRLLQGQGSTSHHSPKYPSRLHSSTSAAAAAEEVLTPTRRVTRSMSRHHTGNTPVEQQNSHAQFEKKPKTPAAIQEELAVDQAAEVAADADANANTTTTFDFTSFDASTGMLEEGAFDNIDYTALLEELGNQNDSELLLPDGFYDTMQMPLSANR